MPTYSLRETTNRVDVLADGEPMTPEQIVSALNAKREIPPLTIYHVRVQYEIDGVEWSPVLVTAATPEQAEKAARLANPGASVSAVEPLLEVDSYGV